MHTTPLTAQRLYGTALAINISTLFSAIWGLNGSAALTGAWRWLTALIVVGTTLIFFRTAYAFRQAASQAPAGSTELAPNPFRTRSYVLAVVAEIIAIPLASRLLVGAGHSDAIMPVIAIIVGLHFFGLIPAFRSWQFASSIDARAIAHG